MKQIISFHLRRVAVFVLFAAGLDLDKLQNIIEKLKSIVENKKFFEPVEEGELRQDPLTFNKDGLKEVRKFGLPLPPGFVTFRDIIKKLDAAIRLAAEGGDENLTTLNTYMDRALRRPEDRWVNVNFKGLSYELARDKALNKVIKPVSIALSSAIKFPEGKEIEIKGG